MTRIPFDLSIPRGFWIAITFEKASMFHSCSSIREKDGRARAWQDYSASRFVMQGNCRRPSSSMRLVGCLAQYLSLALEHSLMEVHELRD